MRDKVVEQLMVIRDSGVTNMFDSNFVAREAYRLGYYELAVFIEEHKKEYVHFILTGERA